MATDWYYQVMGQEVGPVSAADLKRQATEGVILRGTLVRTGADGNWVTADNVRGLLDNSIEANTPQSIPPIPSEATNPYADATRPPPPVKTRNTERHATTRVPASILSLIALGLSIAALAWSIFHDPLGSGMDAYSFKTPEEALRSLVEMEGSWDIRAKLELGMLGNKKSINEKLGTIKVHKTSDYGGKRILFISYEENGISKYEISGFEKDADSGLWFPAYVSSYAIDNEGLKQAVEKWESQSGKIETE